MYVCVKEGEDSGATLGPFSSVCVEGVKDSRQDKIRMTVEGGVI